MKIQTTDSIVMANDITSFFVVEFDDFATYRSVWGKTASNVPRPTDYYALPGSGIAVFYRVTDGPPAVPAGLRPRRIQPARTLLTDRDLEIALPTPAA